MKRPSALATRRDIASSKLSSTQALLFTLFLFIMIKIETDRVIEQIKKRFQLYCNELRVDNLKLIVFLNKKA